MRRKRFPILGDALLRSAPFAGSACMRRNSLCGSCDRKRGVFTAPVDFLQDARLALRCALVIPENQLDAIDSRAGDGMAGGMWMLGDFLLSQGEGELTARQREHLKHLLADFHVSRLTPHASSAYHRS